MENCWLWRCGGTCILAVVVRLVFDARCSYPADFNFLSDSSVANVIGGIAALLLLLAMIFDAVTDYDTGVALLVLL